MSTIKVIHKIKNDNEYERNIEYKEYVINFDNQTLIKDVVDEIDDSHLNIRDYYDISLRAHLYKCDVPYIIQDGILKWNVNINEIKVIDIVQTHNLIDEIHVESYFAEIGGYYHWMDIIELWESILPILIEISKYLGVLFTFEKALNKISNIFIKRKVSPFNVVEFILIRNRWNHSELANLLDLETEETKYFLKALGYKWNKSEHIYINDDTEYIQKKFIKMSVITKKEFKG